MSWFSNLIDKLFHRHHEPPPVPATHTEAIVQAIALAREQHETIQQQATVIASPPIQATINAQPKPVTAVEPSNAAPFGTDNYGSPFQSQAAADAWKAALAVHDANLAQLSSMMAKQMSTGPLDPTSLTHDDLLYIQESATEMTFEPRQLGSGLFYSPTVALMGAEIGNMQRSEYLTFEQTRVNPQVVQFVRDMAKGTILPWMAAAFPELGSPRWRDEHLASWTAGWKRLHPGQEP